VGVVVGAVVVAGAFVAAGLCTSVAGLFEELHPAAPATAAAEKARPITTFRKVMLLNTPEGADGIVGLLGKGVRVGGQAAVPTLSKMLLVQARAST
jgi:hypothetical protein